MQTENDTEKDEEMKLWHVLQSQETFIMAKMPWKN
jgi:hypothetical protein